MKHLSRNWPVYLAIFSALATVGLSIRSWYTSDVIVINTGKSGNLSITCFSFCSCIRGKFSDNLHSFHFGDHEVSDEVGWHTVPVNSKARLKNVWIGRFHFKPPILAAIKDRDLFVGAPIWLLFAVGYLPLVIWILSRVRKNRA